MVTTPTTAVQPAPIKLIEKTAWDKGKPYVGIIGICLLGAYVVYVTKLHFDLVTGVALITLLFMMLQTEHERCDKVRAGWREVRRAAFTLASAVQWAQKKQGHPDEEKYADDARASVQEFYRTLLLYGKGSLRDQYQKALKKKQEEKATLVQMLSVFPELDYKAEQKFATWKLIWL
jgi:hypothetical protein